jgi:predicted glycogen debranching enzyme
LDTGERAALWNAYGDVMKKILRAYRYGTTDVQMHDNGLIWAAGEGKALTWMDAVVDGVPVTGRAGYAVEICALWYNAVCFTLELARDFGDDEFTGEFSEIPVLIKENFFPVFWMDERAHLADYVDAAAKYRHKAQSVVCLFTPVQSPFGRNKESYTGLCSRELLTPRGLRTLSQRIPYLRAVTKGIRMCGTMRTIRGRYGPGCLDIILKHSFVFTGPCLPNVPGNWYTRLKKI